MISQKKKGREELLIVATGGTIEGARYVDGMEKPPVFNKESILPTLMERHQYEYPFTIVSPFMKDSRWIDDQDRAVLAETIHQASQKKIIVSHGTMTIFETFESLKKENFGEKTIVLFGAKVPHQHFKSDAGINLGYAIGAALYAPVNTYVLTNGILLKSLKCDI